MNTEYITKQLERLGKVTHSVSENYDGDEFQIWDVWNTKALQEIAEVMYGVKCRFIKNDLFIAVIAPMASKSKIKQIISARYLQSVITQ